MREHRAAATVSESDPSRATMLANYDAAIARGLADSAAGRSQPIDEVQAELEARYASGAAEAAE